MLIFLDARRTLSFVISLADSGALPNAKLMRCSWSSSSVTALSRDASNARTQFWVGRRGVEKLFPVGHVSPFIRYLMSWMITQVGSIESFFSAMYSFYNLSVYFVHPS